VGSITVPKGKTTTFPEDVPTPMGYLLENYYEKDTKSLRDLVSFYCVLRLFIPFRMLMEE